VKKTVLAKEAAATADESDAVSRNGSRNNGTSSPSTSVVTTTHGVNDNDPINGNTTTHEVQLIVTDVDGTLLNSRQELTMRVEAALARAAASGVPTVLATGKSRGPCARKVLGKLNPPMPGVFVQGCVTCDADGAVVESIELNAVVAQSVFRFAKRNAVTAVAFCGTRILCDKRNADTDKVLAYGEPTPEPVGDMTNVETGINKILLFCVETDFARLREDAEAMFENDCVITTAVAGMLEFLPLGVSKGAAVERLLKRVNVDPKNVLALGDGENDAELLALVGTAVAMKGSSRKVIDAAKGNVEWHGNDEDGVAWAVEKYVLAAKGLAPASEFKMPRDEPIDTKASPDIKTASIAAAVAAAEASARGRAFSQQQKKRGVEMEKARAQNLKLLEASKAAEMEKAKASNLELLEASKAATKRLQELRGQMLETQAALASVEEEETRLISDSVREKAKKLAEASADKFARAAAAEKTAAEAEGKARSGGWGDDRGDDTVSAADTWISAAEDEQRNAVAAAAAAAEARAEAAVADFQQARAEDTACSGSEVVEGEIVDVTDVVTVDTTGNKSDSVSRSSRKQSNAMPEKQMPTFAQIGGFFAAALQTVSRITGGSPEVRIKQLAAERAGAKASLLAVVVSTNLGRDCEPGFLSATLEKARVLETLNPTAKPAKSSLMRGRWSAVFTNSKQLLGMDKSFVLTRQSGPVYMAHDLDSLKSEWQYTWPDKIERARLAVGEDGTKLSMNFEQTKIFGLFSLPKPSKPKEYGELEITYLDLDMMLCRGANAILFVFVQTNTNYRIGNADSADGNRRLR
jgi:Cof subfamily protein (haloacid dehalogenase superfamily)